MAASLGILFSPEMCFDAMQKENVIEGAYLDRRWYFLGKFES
jgi:hypothetical protein